MYSSDAQNTLSGLDASNEYLQHNVFNIETEKIISELSFNTPP